MRIIPSIICAFVAVVAILGDVTANVATATKEEQQLLKKPSAVTGMYLLYQKEIETRT